MSKSRSKELAGLDINPSLLTESLCPRSIPHVRNGAREDVAEPKPHPRGMEALLSQGSLITPSPSMGGGEGGEGFRDRGLLPVLSALRVCRSLGQETLPCHKALASPSPSTPGHSPPLSPSRVLVKASACQCKSAGFRPAAGDGWAGSSNNG